MDGFEISSVFCVNIVSVNIEAENVFHFLHRNFTALCTHSFHEIVTAQRCQENKQTNSNSSQRIRHCTLLASQKLAHNHGDYDDRDKYAPTNQKLRAKHQN